MFLISTFYVNNDYQRIEMWVFHYDVHVWLRCEFFVRETTTPRHKKTLFPSQLAPSIPKSTIFAHYWSIIVKGLPAIHSTIVPCHVEDWRLKKTSKQAKDPYVACVCTGSCVLFPFFFLFLCLVVAMLHASFAFCVLLGKSIILYRIQSII